MGTYKITSTKLAAIGPYKVSGRYLLFLRKGWHIRVDMKPVDNKGLMGMKLIDKAGKETGEIGYILSSFHIKRDNNHAFISTDEDTGKDMKINDEEANYVYFVFAGGGVWQPIWGYRKHEQKHKGEVVYRFENGEVDGDLWAFACDKARGFLEQMSKATGQDHGLAMGPIQGTKANLFAQL